MKATAIVYTSNTGYTAKYAKSLGEQTGLPVCDLPTALRELPHAAVIVYLGWLRAGSVVGLKKAAKTWQVAAVCAVGQAPAESNQAEKLKERFPAAFYLRGGYDYSRLTGVDRVMMWSMTRLLTARAGKDAEAAAMVKQLAAGGDWVEPAALAPVIQAIRE